MHKIIAPLLIAAACACANIQISDPLYRDSARCDYLIICANENGMLAQAARLAEAKWQKGLKTAVVNVDSIARSVSGVDLPHKIRNFLKEAHTSWGVTWVLLIGDLTLIPARKVSSGGLYFPYDTNSVASDVYYACLDGEWDFDGDGIYGNEQSVTNYSIRCSFESDSSEASLSCTYAQTEQEGLDLWYDVYIGRLPASNAQEAKIMIDKIFAYRSTPRTGTYAADMAMMAAKIHNVWSNTSIGIEVDDATYYWHYQVKPFFDNASQFRAAGINELYEDRVLDDGSAVNDSIEITYTRMSEFLSRGYNMIFYTFHGNPRGIRICSFPEDRPKPDYAYDRVLKLNSQYYSNIMSISCSIMKMIPDSNTCFAKSFLTNPNGGAVSYTGASGIDYFNIRGRHYSRAIDYLCNKNINRIAQAYQLANVKEFCRHNLFVHQHWGDPELEMWTNGAADSLTVDVDLSDDKYVVTVSPALDSVLVCVYKKDEVFMRGYTKNGKVIFDAADGSIDDIMLTATCHNFIPFSMTMNSQAVLADRLPPAALQGGMSVSVAGSKTCIIFAENQAPVHARLLTVSGRTIEQFSSQRGGVWRVSTLPAGVYIVKARIGTRSLSSKVVVRQ